MNLQEFRNLDDRGLKDWVGTCLILGQNPRLRRGDDLTTPVAAVANGRLASHDTDGVQTVQAITLRVDIQAVLDGHPWITLPEIAKEANYFHMYEVRVLSSFDRASKPAAVGDLIPVQQLQDWEAIAGVKFKIPLTQELIDQFTYVTIRVAFSK